MRIWIIAISVLWSVCTVAQTRYFDAAPQLDDNKLAIEFNTELYASSNAISNQFLYGFISGGKISSSTQEMMLKNTSHKNRLGLDFNTGFSVHLKPDNQNKITYHFGVHDRQHANASFSGNAFKLLIDGNKQFAGEEIDMSDFSFSMLRYQQIRAGISWKYKPGKSFHLSASFLNGEQYQSAQMDYLTLYSSAYGDEIRFNGGGAIYQTDPENKGFAKSNGYGASIDIQHDWELALGQSQNGRLSVALNDIGFIAFDGNSRKQEIDTLYSFKGTQLGNVILPFDTSYTFIGPDSVADDILQKKDTTGYNVMLPGWFRVNLYQQFERFDVKAGFQARFNASQKPYFYVESKYFLNEKWKLGGILGAGGYSNFNIGTSVEYSTDKITLQALSQHLESVVVPSRLGGLNLQIRAIVKI
ncbi:DUF5723 family protein [Salibacter sp.]|uniref:DUF5723 family protein n=1 Tax=Salibacter sp. TaxID=2010995 RepID=UPI00287079A7|nr:DUF5723 family protein [Salibacter sp.]MDR9398853.1 DUF5723 family protein [Salibacter sp.]MDR9487326.1 DUF5723 family protein [Salibacter sp.]